LRSEELLLTPSQRTLWVKTHAMLPKIIMLATVDSSNITRIHDKYVVSLGIMTGISSRSNRWRLAFSLPVLERKEVE